MYPAGVRTSATFYGAYKPSQVVVLVEGAGDVMALEQAGIPDHWTVLGCFGSGLHSPQVQLLADLSPKLVITAFDDDEAGWGASERAVFQLNDIAPVLSHQWSTVGGNDPGDVEVGKRITSIQNLIANSPYNKHR
jgi:DNA primase